MMAICATGFIKKRIPVPGVSERESARSLVACRVEDKIFFMDAYTKASIPKNGSKELPFDVVAAYKVLAASLLNATDDNLKQDMKIGLIREVDCDDRQQIATCSENGSTFE